MGTRRPIGAVLVTVILWLHATTAAAAAAPQPSAVVPTASGPVQGLVEDGIATFKGIRYGAPPIGEHRFKAPRPPAPWQDVQTAAGFGAPAMQSYDRPHNGTALSMQLATVFTMRADMKIDNEDSLFLNVWTPATDDGDRPVMVWLHGGGYAYGSGAWPVYDGASLARRGDVVVVTVNHRLNVFGYLHLAGLLGDDYADSGNAGMLDLVLALEWVRDNIGAFGGDPGNVTIMGESGGGSKVSHLMAMPAADGLFHKAIVQSGPGLTGVPADQATAAARAIVAKLGVDPDDRAAVRRALTTATADAIAAAAEAAQAEAGGGFGRMRLAPVVDGRHLPRDPFVPTAPEQSSDVPLLIGWNKDEMTIFNTGAPWFGQLTEQALPERVAQVVGDKADALLAVYREMYPDYSPTYLYNAILGDSRMFIGSVLLAERQAALGGAPVYMYYLTWETPVGGGVFKSPHTLDIPFMFANVDRAVALTGDGPGARALEDQMSGAWIAFARTGRPGHGGLPDWPAYDAASRPAMVFDVPPRVVQDPNREVRRLLTPQ
ncbi:MAG: carboxylesterase [Gammaproteobacteria bacterium]|nr:carboxylesterase [Gammaproteobacteria bacterium]MBK81618.1 carboxylesterase [Gammaproteobacteria bacterium]